MKAKTIFICDICDSEHSSEEDCRRHERDCRLGKDLVAALADLPLHDDENGNPVHPWNPPLLKDMRRWHWSDTHELARRIRKLFVKWHAEDTDTRSDLGGTLPPSC